MKKIYLAIFIITIFTTFSIAQTEKGNFFAGTSLIGTQATDFPFSNGLTFNAKKDDTQVFVKPVFAYFLAKNFAIGLGYHMVAINTKLMLLL